MTESYDEWRVTGETSTGEYAFTWSPRLQPHGNISAEQAAKKFVEMARGHGTWTKGPFLYKRTVHEDPWEEVQ